MPAAISEVTRFITQEMLALMKKKAEAEAEADARKSVDGAHVQSSVSCAEALPDDAQELIAAMQSQSEASGGARSLDAEKAQKSRARRLTSTAVAVEAAVQPQAAGLRESSGELDGVCMWGGGEGGFHRTLM